MLEKVIDDLLKLNWVNITAERKELPGVLGFFGDERDTRVFQVLNGDSSVFLKVEFHTMEFYEGPISGSIYSKSGKLLDANGNVIEESDKLCDTYGRLDHNLPLAKLYRKLWNSVLTPPLQKQDPQEKEKIKNELKLEIKKITKELQDAGWIS